MLLARLYTHIQVPIIDLFFYKDQVDRLITIEHSMTSAYQQKGSHHFCNLPAIHLAHQGINCLQDAFHPLLLCHIFHWQKTHHFNTRATRLRVEITLMVTMQCCELYHNKKNHYYEKPTKQLTILIEHPVYL